MTKIFLICAAMSATLSPAFAKCDSGEKVIRFGMAISNDSPIRQRAALRLKQTIDKELQGKICLQILRDDSLYADELSVTAVQAGNLELAAPRLSALGKQFSDFQIYGLPFAFRNVSSVEKFYTLSDASFKKSLTNSNLTQLGLWQGTFGQIAAKRPVYYPSDVAGMKFRFDNALARAALPGRLKVTASAVSENDLSIAIKNGRVDAQFTHWTQLNDDKSGPLLNGVTQMNLDFEGYQLLASQSWWTGLEHTVSKQLSELISRTTRQLNFETQQKATSAKRALMRASIPVRILTRKQTDEWREVTKPIWEDFENEALKRLLDEANLGL